MTTRRSRRLLVVDDEPNLLRAVSACLSAEGFDVTTAHTVEEALVSLAQTVPDLLISDIRMPGKDGYSLVRQLRSSPRTRLIPVVLLTARDQTVDRIAGFRAGVDAYVTKPFEPEELMAIIDSILDRVQRTQGEIARLVATSKKDDQIRINDEDLTEAEQQIAAAVARGLSNKEIAVEFVISVRTVETHISHILTKKGFANRVEIARFVFERSRSE
ncbi:MAG TPA: response regulator transcription factor [Blastocatellia bacterium]|nr:response regulator transcription factor [Blastocatellia bacterium]